MILPIFGVRVYESPQPYALSQSFGINSHTEAVSEALQQLPALQLTAATAQQVAKTNLLSSLGFRV